MCELGCKQERVKPWVVVFYVLAPMLVYVAESPGVFEFRSCGCGAYRGCVVGVAVERRVQIDQVNGAGVDAAHDLQIVACPDGLVGEVPGRLRSLRGGACFV